MNDFRNAPGPRLWAVAAMLLLAGSAFAAPGVIRVATNKGRLVIEIDDPDVEVRVKRGGEQITVFDPKTQREVTLQAGTYQLELVQGKEGEGRRLSPPQFTLERGGREIVRVRLEPAVTARPPGAESAGEIRRFDGHQGHVLSVAFGPDGKCVASTGYDMTVKVWDRASGKQVLNLTGHGGGAVDDVAFSPDGKLLASAGAGDRVVKVWDGTTGKEVFSLRGHTTSVYGVAFSPDGKHLVSGSGDQTVKVWDVGTGKEVRTLKAPGMGLVFRVAYSPDGKLLASGGAVAKVWDAESGKEIRSLAKPALLVAFSPDSRRLATASGQTVSVWDGASGREILTFAGQSEIWGLAFSPDGKRLATAGDLTVKIWDAATGTEELTLKGHTDKVRCVVFRPDGRQVLSGSNDLTVRLWDLPPADKDPKANATKPASQNQDFKEPKPRDVADGWEPLFNGKDLGGWSVEGGDPGAWQVERGELLVDSHSLPANEQGIHGATSPRRYNFLLTEKTYSEFLLRFEYQLFSGANSGVALWATPNEKVYREGPIHLEVKLLDDASYPTIGWPTGTLFWNQDGGGHLLRPDRAAKLEPVGAWNQVEVEARAQLLRISVNGLEVLHARPDKLAEEQGAFAGLKRYSGHLGFEKNAGVARFRNIAIKELP